MREGLTCNDPKCPLHGTERSSVVETLEELKLKAFSCAQNAAKGNVSLMARVLGINRTTIHRMFRNYPANFESAACVQRTK